MYHRRHSHERPVEVNAAVRNQAAEVSELHARMYSWTRQLRQLVAAQASVAIPEVALSIEKGRRERMGWYHIGRDGLQLCGRITLNSLYIQGGLPECWLVEILAHEILHFAEELATESSQATHSSFHTAWFRRHARTLGFPCDDKGRSTTTEIDPASPFGTLLRQGGVQLVPLAYVGAGRAAASGSRQAGEVVLPPSRSTMVRWSCRCTNVRAATRVEARCLRCGEAFERAGQPAPRRPSLESERSEGRNAL